MGSVKDLVVDEPATDAALGEGRFRFSDRYSVFDWGEMPDHIAGKGASLCLMGAYNFELLEDEGVDTHYLGVLPADADGDAPADDAVPLADVDEAPREMAVALAQVPELPFDADEGYDYDAYHAAGGDCAVIPLEVVFRNSVPVGSSLRDRRDPADLGLELDGDGWPDESVALDEPVVEFSTKYEEQDRYLDDEEARQISGLDDEGFDALRETALAVNEVVTERADDVGLDHQDGKIECVHHDGQVLVADVVGTFDENRFLRDGQQLSKEFLRQFYKEYDPDWVEAVDAAKREADEEGVADWRGLCELSPKPLPEDVAATASDLYRSGANRYVGEDWFDAPPLDDVVERMARTRPA